MTWLRDARYVARFRTRAGRVTPILSRSLPRSICTHTAARERLLTFAQRAALADAVPGLTIHQAKGREWRRVGVALSAAELGRLAHGLVQDQETDRRIYVGLTRAREATVLV